MDNLVCFANSDEEELENFRYFIGNHSHLLTKENLKAMLEAFYDPIFGSEVSAEGPNNKVRKAWLQAQAVVLKASKPQAADIKALKAMAADIKALKAMAADIKALKAMAADIKALKAMFEAVTGNQK